MALPKLHTPYLFLYGPEKILLGMKASKITFLNPYYQVQGQRIAMNPPVVLTTDWLLNPRQDTEFVEISEEKWQMLLALYDN